MLLGALFDATSARPVLRMGDQALSASELLERAGLAARCLSSQGVVALEAVPTVEYVAALIGCLAAGEALCPSRPRPAARACARYQRLGAQIFVAGPDDEKYPGCRAISWRHLAVTRKRGLSVLG